MSENTQQVDESPRLKIQNLISLYEKSSSHKVLKPNYEVHKLSARISDFNWNEREVSHAQPKLTEEIKISDYVSVKRLIKVYQQISQQASSPYVTRKSSITKLRKEETYAYNEQSSLDPGQPAQDLNKDTNKSRQDIKERPPSVVVPQPKPSDSVSSVVEPSNLSHVTPLPKDEKTIDSKVSEITPIQDKTNDIEPTTDDYPSSNGFTPLPSSYSASRNMNGVLTLVLPPSKGRSNLKSKSGRKKSVGFIEEPTQIIETYNVYEYERGDEDLDPVASSAQYEIEKKTESLDKFYVTLIKGGKGLGLSIVGIGLGSDTGEERLGIYVKALTPGGVAETEGSLKVQDQILEVDGVSLIGVSQKFAGETLKATGQTVKFLIGREKGESS